MYGLPNVKPCTVTDIHKVCLNLRKSDKEECTLFHPHHSPEHSFITAVTISDLLLGLYDDSGEPIGILGIVECASGWGACVWMLGTPELTSLTNAKKVLRQGKELVQKLKESFGGLWNFCNNSPSQKRFLEALGFTVVPQSDKTNYFSI